MMIHNYACMLVPAGAHNKNIKTGLCELLLTRRASVPPSYVWDQGVFPFRETARPPASAAQGKSPSKAALSLNKTACSQAALCLQIQGLAHKRPYRIEI